MKPYFVLRGLLDEGLGQSFIGYDARHFSQLKRFWRENPAGLYAINKCFFTLPQKHAVYGRIIPAPDSAERDTLLIAKYWRLYDQPINPICSSYAIISLEPEADVAQHIHTLRSHPLPKGSKLVKVWAGQDKSSSLVELLEHARDI